MNGEWVHWYPGGQVGGGTFVDGLMQGEWTMQWYEGSRIDIGTGQMVDGLLQGPWSLTMADGRKCTQEFNAGAPMGQCN